MNLLDLPNLMLIEIFEYLPYDEVAKKRVVCRRIDQICQYVLNCGFNKVVRQHNINFKRIKALLPRRESERRNHYLARHADILTSIETRISMLSMTYTKYIDLKMCCFIPGRVLDEVFQILRLISKTTRPLRPHEVLQELRDISSMAIEHFDEKIATHLKKAIAENNGKLCTNMESSRMSSTPNLSAMSLNIPIGGTGWHPTHLTVNAPNIFNSNFRCCDSIRGRNVPGLLNLGQSSFLEGINKPTIGLNTNDDFVNVGLHEPQGCPEARIYMIYFKKLKLEYKQTILQMHRILQIQRHQARRLQQTLASVTEQNVQLTELKKRVEELDAKNRELSASIKQINSGEPPTASGSSPKAPEATAVSSVALSKSSNNNNENCTIVSSSLKKRRYVDESPSILNVSTLSPDTRSLAMLLQDDTLPTTTIKKPKI